MEKNRALTFKTQKLGSPWLPTGKLRGGIALDAPKACPEKYGTTKLGSFNSY